MPTSDPTKTPTTPSPTSCSEQLWHYKVSVGCTNNDDIDENTDTVYESSEECCAARYPAEDGVDCVVYDDCAPTATPSSNPTKKPVMEWVPTPTSPAPSNQPSGAPSCSKDPDSDCVTPTTDINFTSAPTLMVPETIVTPSPTANPTTAAPVTLSCEGRKFHHHIWKGCTNEFAPEDDTATLYDTAEECCSAKYVNSVCVYYDDCAPTGSPSKKPTNVPTSPPTAKIFTDTLEPTVVEILPIKTLMPVSSDTTPAPTSVATISITLDGKGVPTAAPTDSEVAIEPTASPSFGGTPTVGTEKTLPPVLYSRGDGRKLKKKKLRNMM